MRARKAAKPKAASRKPAKAAARAPRTFDERKARDAVLAAAMKAFPAQGFQAVTLGSVAKAAKVPEAAVKKLFRSKLHLFAAVVETRREMDLSASNEELGLALVRGDGDLRASIEALIRLQMPRIQDTVRWRGLYGEFAARSRSRPEAQTLALLEDNFMSRILGQIEELKRHGVIDRAIDLDALQLLWGAMMDGLAIRHALLPERFDGPKLAAAIADILTRGLAPRG